MDELKPVGLEELGAAVNEFLEDDARRRQKEIIDRLGITTDEELHEYLTEHEVYNAEAAKMIQSIMRLVCGK